MYMWLVFNSCSVLSGQNANLTEKKYSRLLMKYNNNF